MLSPYRVFLLSPANCSGKRASYLLGKDGRSPLAQRLRSGGGATLGEVFTFMSGLYFRGKLAYARAFASAPSGGCAALVIVPGQGLHSPDTVIDHTALKAIARIPVDPDDRRYLRPLVRDAELLASELDPAVPAILLGSIATSKYLEPLFGALGSRLRVPREFIGRGDMSRGALMLRSAAQGSELTYIACDDPAALVTRRPRAPLPA